MTRQMGEVQRANVEKVRKMYYDEGMTTGEIAIALNFAISTVSGYICLGNKIFGENENPQKKTWKRKDENKPLTYKQIKAKSEKFQAEHGIRWGEGYIKLEPKPIEKVDLSKYETIPLRGRKKKAKRK